MPAPNLKLVPGASVSPEDKPVIAVQNLDFAAVYKAWFVQVCRFVRALGARDADIEDIAQEVFLIVRRKLATFDGANMGGWLYTISANTVRDYRRRAWFRRVFLRESPLVDFGEADDRPLSTPAALVEHQEEQRLLQAILEKMSDTHRATFVLFEIEGYSGEEISLLQDIPLATVWSRLHYGRKEFFRLTEKFRQAENRKGKK